MSDAAQDGEGTFPSFNSLQIQQAFASDIERDHGDRPLLFGDQARIWRHNGLEGVELFQGSYRKYEFARHFHRIPAIGVVEHGSMSSYCRRGNHILGPGTVLLLNPGEIHAPAPAGSAGWSFRMFYLEQKLFKSLSLDFSMEALRFRQPFVCDSELASNLFQLHRELEEDGDSLRFESLLLAILSRLAEVHSEVISPAAELRSDTAKIELVREYLEANYDQNLSLQELAEVSSFSASHFLRMFRDTVGLTPHAYLTQVRIEVATSLLRSGTPLIEVANLVGFTDQSHFTKKFKRMFGITPGQYALNSKGYRRRTNLRSHRNRLTGGES